jgi:uncharacterized protein DUF6599
MRRILGVSILAVSLAALPASAQKILPASVAGWTSTGEPMVQREAAPQQVLIEYGLASTEYSRFEHGQEFLDAYLYKLKDASGAYGFYSFLRTPDMRRANFTEHSSISRDRALVLTGNLVLDIGGRDLPRSASQLKALVAAVAPHGEEGSLPTLPLYLPEKDRIDASDRYVLGPQTLDQLFPGGIGASVGFDHGGEAELAHYRLGGRDATLLLVGLPTDQVAALQLERLQRDFNINGASQPSGARLFASRSARLLAIAAGASSQAEANTLLDKIQMETERSWNEPVPKHEPPIELMIEGSIIGSITICLFALVAGFSFGGVRLLVKRLAPGKVFDRNNHLQVLQLGLGSKPINADDFYGYSAQTGTPTVVDKNLPDRVALRIFR